MNLPCQLFSEDRYAYNPKGLMISRSENVLKHLESYEYDQLDRLTKITSGAMGQTGTPQTFSYHNNGNISNNSNVGYYTYMGKPHAVGRIEPVSPDVMSNEQCDVIYNSFNQPAKITEGNYWLDLSYGVNQQRQKTERYKNNSLEFKRYYIDKRYETDMITIDRVSDNERQYHYIYGDNGVVALYVVDRFYDYSSNGGATDYTITTIADSMYYIHTDHLGSYCAITDANKGVKQRNYFDPWGNFRLIVRTGNGFSFSPDPPAQGIPTLNFTLTDRGFTGHEHYPYFKIINMNGRLYDPVIARFFSPDKFVANSSFTQDFNRYTYARNNPLMYTDPDGEFIVAALIIGAAINAVAYTASVAMSDGGFKNWNTGQFFLSMGIGAISGAITAGIGTAFGPVGSAGLLGELGRAGTHAYANFVISGAFGQRPTAGTFATSFASSLIGSGTHNFSTLGQIGISTLTGGVMAELTGGKFWQGAANGAIISALNHTAHEVERKLIYDKTFKRPGAVPLSRDAGYQWAAYKMKLQVMQEGNELTLTVDTDNSHVDGRVVPSAKATLMVDGKPVSRQVVSLSGESYVYSPDGWKPLGETIFSIPQNGKVSIKFEGGWNVYMNGGAAVPVYHPLFFPRSININRTIIIR